MRRAILLLCTLSIAVLIGMSAAAAKRVALVIGIDRYDILPEQQQLKKAVNDAHALGDALRAVGYEVLVMENADRRSFNEVWQKFLSLLEPGDEATFFFAGHGLEIAGQNYLLPRDVPKPLSGESFLVKNESLSVFSHRPESVTFDSSIWPAPWADVQNCATTTSLPRGLPSAQSIPSASQRRQTRQQSAPLSQR